MLTDPAQTVMFPHFQSLISSVISSMDVVKYCQHCFSFDMPSDWWEKRARTFECKFSEFCHISVVKFLSVYLSGCLFIRLFYSYYHYHAFGEIKIYRSFHVLMYSRQSSSSLLPPPYTIFLSCFLILSLFLIVS